MSSNQNISSQQPTLPPFSDLARPEELANFPHSEASRARYVAGITELWHQINSSSPGSGPFRLAVMKLVDVSTVLRNEYEAAQESLLALATAQRENPKPHSAEQLREGDASAAFDLMVKTIAKSRMSKPTNDRGLLKEAGGLVVNQAGLLEFRMPTASVPQQVAIADANTMGSGDIAAAEAEVREDLQAALGFIGQPNSGNFSTGDVEAALTLLEIQAEAKVLIESNNIVSPPLQGQENGIPVSNESDRGSPAEAKSWIEVNNITFTPVSVPLSDREYAIALNNGINSQSSEPRRSLRKKSLANPKAYSSKWHPIDDGTNPQ